MASVHWGGSRAREVPAAHRAFAHRLLDAGVFDALHGHASHRPLPIEVYRGRLVPYGCGDRLNDCEGIGAHGSPPLGTGVGQCDGGGWHLHWAKVGPTADRPRDKR